MASSSDLDHLNSSSSVESPVPVHRQRSQSSLNSSEGGKQVRKITEKKSFKHLLKTWGIDNEPLIRAFHVAYRKPYNSKGQLYVFPNYFGYVSKTTQVCRSWDDVKSMECKKGNHSPKQFLFISAGAPELLHKIRGRGGSQRRMAATMLLVWQCFKGDTTVDLVKVRTDTSYVMQHPSVKQLLAGSEADLEGSEDEGASSDSDLDTTQGLPSPIMPSSPKMDATAIAPEANVSSDMPKPVVALPEVFRTALAEPKNESDTRECVVPYGMNRVWALLFSESSSLVKDYLVTQKAQDFVSQKWKRFDDYMERENSYIKPVESRLVSGTANIVQIQRACIVAGKLLVYSETRTTGIPKGDCFVSKSMFEITTTGGSTKIHYSAWLDWVKSGGVLKGTITSRTIDAILSSFESLMGFMDQNKEQYATDTESVPAPQVNPMQFANEVRPGAISPNPVRSALDTPPQSGLATPTTLSPPATPIIPPARAGIAITKPESSGSQSGLPFSLSLLELVLLVLLAVFVCATFYYRAQASSLAHVLRERNEAILAAAQAAHPEL